MAIKRIELLQNVAATGAAKPVAFAGEYIFRLSGTISGATVALEQQAPDRSSWLPVPNASLTAVGSVAVKLAAGVDIRATVTGGTPSALFAAVDALFE